MFKVCGLIVLISVYFIANLALANEEAPVVIYTEDFPLHQYMENGKLIGPALNKVRRIFDLANISYEIKVLPWPRAFNLAKKIPNSFIFSMNRTTEREAFFNWLYPVSTIENHFITLADNPITLS